MINPGVQACVHCRLPSADKLTSGKSSVLEGLTGLPFPRDKGLCTRFATQILFKRDPVQRTVVSIIPDKGASREHVEEVEAWKKSELQELDRERFSRIMSEVSSTILTHCVASGIRSIHPEVHKETDSILGS